jgi:hypothetical protein
VFCTNVCVIFHFHSCWPKVLHLFTKNLSWQAKKSIPHTTVTIYGNCVKMCEDFGDKRTGCCSRTTHHLTLPFHLGIF